MPNIIIGVGGVGVGIVRRVKRAIEQNLSYAGIRDQMFFLGIDIQPDYEASIGPINMANNFYISDPAKAVQALMKNKEFTVWWPHFWNPTDPWMGSYAGGQIRTAGKTVFYMHYDEMVTFIDSTINQANSVAATIGKATATLPIINTFITGSLGGGTGSGMIVDLGFLVRSLIKSTERLFGVFLDGSITRLFAEEKTELNGFATLTEIERWMAKASEYNMAFPGTGNTLKGLNKFFDLVYLVNSKNIDGRTFVGSSDDIRGKYQDLSAQFIELITTNTAFQTSTAANKLNPFMVPHKISGRSINYAGFSISYISFPVEKVTDYCTSKYIDEEFLKYIDINLPEIEFMEKDEKIREWDGNHLTQEFHANASYIDLNRRYESAINKFSKCAKGEAFRTCYNESKLNDMSTWDEGLKAHSDSIEQLCTKKYEAIKDKLEMIVHNAIPSLQFEKIHSFLVKFEGKIEKNLESIDKNKLPFLKKRDTYRNEIKKSATALFVLKDSIWSKKYSSALSDFTKLMKNWYDAELCYYEYPKISYLYDSLAQLTKILRWTINYLQQCYAVVEQDYQKTYQKYSSHEYLLNPERMKKDDYILDMEISVDRKTVNDLIYPQIKSALYNDRGTIQSIIKAGKGDYLPGVWMIFDELYKQYASADNDKIRTVIENKLNESKGQYSAKIKALLSNAVRENVKIGVGNFNIENAIDWYLSRLLKELKDAKGNQDKYSEITAKIKILFGDEATSLFSISKENQWKNEAAAMLMRRMVTLTKPFIDINYYAAKQQRIKNTMIPHQSAEFTQIYHPNNFSYAKNPIPNVEYKIDSNPHRVTFFSQYSFFPISALNGIRRASEIYLKHMDDCQKQWPTFPIHTDIRFYDAWRDNITETRDESEDISRLLLILGLGFEKISIDKSTFTFKKKDSTEKPKKIRGLLKTLDYIRLTTAFRQGLAGLIHEIYEKESIDNGKDVKKVAYKVFKTANNRLKKWSLDVNDETYKEWQNLIHLCEFNHNDVPIGALIPQNDNDMDIQITIVKQAVVAR